MALGAGALNPGPAVAADPVPPDLFSTLPGLEVTVWARSPMLRNPTNMDVDRAGRIWVAEGVNYRPREIETLFRPSDVCVGPDGAVYDVGPVRSQGRGPRRSG